MSTFPVMPSARDIAAAVRDGTTSVTEIVQGSLDRADAVRAGRDGLNLLLWRDDDAVRRSARDVNAGALQGVPVVLKDNISTTELPTTCGSKILEGYVAPYDATAVRRLRDAGAVIVAKANMDEFAMGSSTENSAYGPAHNPLDPTRVPGGSSGGSAGAVAAGIVPIAFGSETGGSVRQPAAFCGVVGVKPTYGRVSRFGLVAFASSLDQIGVFGATVDDAALAMRVIAGHDEHDSTSSRAEVPDYSSGANASLKGVVIGLPKEYFPAALDPAVRQLCDRAIERLRGLGAEIRDVSLPHTEPCDSGLLHHRAGRSVVEPRAVRRRAVRQARRRRRASRHVRGDALGRLRPRGDASHHPRHLRALGRLLRRLL